MSRVIEADTVPAAYARTLLHLVQTAELVPCQGRQTREAIGVTVKVRDPIYNISTDMGRRFNYRYMIGEAMWNLCPRSDMKFLSALSKGIGKFVEDQPMDTRDHATWAYGPSIHPDLSAILHLLKEHPETRRAVLRPGRHTYPAQRGVGTPPCLEFVEFLLRGNYLHCVVFMRSNDAFLGMPYDMFTYTLWQRALATALGVKVGHYTHTVGSMHYYLADESKVLEIAHGGFDEHALALVEDPNLEEAADGRLQRDLTRCLDVFYGVEVPSSDFEAKSWLGMLAAVCKFYPGMDLNLQHLHDRKIGIGW